MGKQKKSGNKNQTMQKIVFVTAMLNLANALINLIDKIK